MDDREKEEAGKFAGLGLGALGGARIGSMIPIPIVGTFVGGVVGAAVGSEVGKRVGKAVINAGGAFVDTMKAPEGGPASAAEA